MGKVIVDGKEVKKLTFLEILKRVGPGIILTGVVIGPGNITTSAMLGANYGYKMIWLIVPIAFMGIEKSKLEMLFIKNSERGKGLGKKLLNYGIKKYNVNDLAVNEDNPQAKSFYEHMGFKVYQRNELDAYKIL